MLRRLLATPPPDFVAARNALAKEIRRAGDKAGADAIAALRRPSWTDWALNTAAAERPDPVETFAAAAEAMRDAQAAAVEGRDSDLGGALRALRVAIATLAKEAAAILVRSGRPGDLADLVERLGAVAADEQACRQIVDGVLRVGDGTPDDAVLTGLPAAATPAARTPAASASTSGDGRRGRSRSRPAGRDATTEAATDAADAAEHAAERRRLMREIADAERAQRTSAQELARIERSLADAAAKHAAAIAAVERANRDLAAAEQRRDELVERRDAVNSEIDGTARTADGLRARLDEIAAQRHGA